MSTSPKRPYLLAILFLAPLLGAAGCEPSGARFDPTTGVLTVIGTPQSDILWVGRTPVGELQVNGGAMPIRGGVPTVGNTVRVEIRGKGGDDTLFGDESQGALPVLWLFGHAGADHLSGATGHDRLDGGADADELDGGDGNDLILAGPGDDIVVWSPGDDHDTVEGQDGFDTLVFNGANVAENLEVSASADGRVRLFRDVASVTLDLDGVEAIDWNARGGADTVVVRDLAGADLVDLHAALAASSGSGDAAPDTVIVEGTPLDDVVLAVGDASGVAMLGLAAQVTISGAEAAQDRLSIRTLAGDDVVDATGLTADAIALVADGGADHDVLMGGDGADVLLGGEGDDVLLGGPGLDILDGGPGDNIVIQ